MLQYNVNYFIYVLDLRVLGKQLCILKISFSCNNSRKYLSYVWNYD